MLLKKIPNNQLPGEHSSNKYTKESLVSVSMCPKRKIVVTPAYYMQNIPGAVSDCMVREGVMDRLICALGYLPDTVTFQVFDAWRPVKVQQFLYDQYYKTVKESHPDLSEAQLAEKIKPFVSSPVFDEEKPMVHSTGGAIDLTLFDLEKNAPFDMGTEFDDFTEKAHTPYFENTENGTVKNNRRMLYNSMLKAGFTNLPSEWWHYDFGDKFWSYYTGRPAVYGGIKGD